MYKDRFIDAIHKLTKITLTFLSKEDGRRITRLCAPMDYGPSRTAKNKADRFHLWDYESDSKNHVLSLLPDQVIDMQFTDEKFDPSEFVTWKTNWMFDLGKATSIVVLGVKSSSTKFTRTLLIFMVRLAALPERMCRLLKRLSWISLVSCPCPNPKMRKPDFNGRNRPFMPVSPLRTKNTSYE